jgi:malyl-CoA/(S)-citramalyl-CoA lyase
MAADTLRAFRPARRPASIVSLTVHPQRTDRLLRSELAVPGSQPRLFEKAARSAADAVYIDLEDSVAPGDKADARRNAIAALNALDWGAKTVEVRVNGIDTPYLFRDLIDIVSSCPRLDLVIVPKIAVAADVYAVDVLLSQIEQENGRTRRVGIVALIESALGVANLEAIAQSSPRLEGMTFGSGDFAASTRMRTTGIGALSAGYAVLADPQPDGTRMLLPADPWHAVHSRLVIACRAYGLRPLDGPYADFGDGAGFAAAARRAAALGFEGKMCIHPSQIADANAIFRPSEAEVAEARRIVEAMQAAARAGHGAVQLEGRMIDIVSIRMAEQLIARADMIAARGG